MTTETRVSPPSAQTRVDPDPDGLAPDAFEPPDSALDLLIEALSGDDESGTRSTIVTLSFAGTLVTGRLVSLVVWTRGIKQWMAQSSPRFAEALETLFLLPMQDVIETTKRRVEKELPLPARKFIHLQDVRIGYGASATSMKFWRGRLSEVSGWATGSHG
jgi:hypothetical protein